MTVRVVGARARPISELRWSGDCWLDSEPSGVDVLDRLADLDKPNPDRTEHEAVIQAATFEVRRVLAAGVD